MQFKVRIQIHIRKRLVAAQAAATGIFKMLFLIISGHRQGSVVPASSHHLSTIVKITSKKRQPDGRAERRQLLARHGFETATVTLRGAAPDDILDAMAVCRTATLIAAGDAKCLGSVTQRDRHGLPMNIWF